MQIFVQSFLNSATRLTIEVAPSDSIENLRATIASGGDGISVGLFNGVTSDDIWKRVALTGGTW